jgi:hypothetical protein
MIPKSARACRSGICAAGSREFDGSPSPHCDRASALEGVNEMTRGSQMMGCLAVVRAYRTGAADRRKFHSSERVDRFSAAVRLSRLTKGQLSRYDCSDSLGLVLFAFDQTEGWVSC